MQIGPITSESLKIAFLRVLAILSIVVEVLQFIASVISRKDE